MLKNNLNPNFVRWVFKTILLGFVLGTIFILLLAALTGCNTPRRIERLDQKAVDRVSAKRPLLDKLAPAILDLYGNKPDTMWEHLPGGVDSIPYPVPVLDQQQRDRILDSLKKEFTGDCDAAVASSYEAGYNNALIDLKSQKLPVKQPDTLRGILQDQRIHGLFEQNIKDLNTANSQKDGRIAQLNIQIHGLEKENDTKFWWLIGAIAALVISNVLWLYGKIKNPFK